MRVVINNCFGGFSLSPLATKRLAELNGKKCYFYKQDIKQGFNSDFIPISIKEADKEFGCVFAFSVPNINAVLDNNTDFNEMTDKEKDNYNVLYNKYEIADSDIDRDNPQLIQVIEELGEYANGRCAKLKIVEIPDDADWEIAEYDGNEHIAEKHETWY